MRQAAKQSAQRLAPGRLVAQELWRREALAVLLRQLVRARDEFLDADRVDELRGAAGPGREADAEDGADVGIVRGRQHALLQAARGLDGLAIENAVLHLLQIPGHVPAVEDPSELGPQELLAVLRIIVETAARGA